MAVVKNLIIRAGADFSSMRREIIRAQQTIENFSAGVGKAMKLVGAVFAGFTIGSALKDTVSDAMKVEAAIMVINRQMGQSAKVFLDWANTSATAFNMSRSEAIRYGATYSNLITTFTQDTADAQAKTTELLKASAVVASATGRSMEDVMERIRSGMLGNTEAIEDLGVNIYVNLLQTTQAFKKFAGDKSWDQLSFQTQQQIRYFAILEQVANKFGTEVYDNTASRQAQFVAQLKNTQLALGQAFLPIYNSVLPALTKMATALANAMNWLAQFMRALFGYKEKQPGAAIVDQAAAVNDLGDAYANTGKKAKKAQTQLASFDNLNTIGQKSDAAGAAGDTGTAAGTGPSVISDMADDEEAPTKIQKLADKVRNTLNQLADDIRSTMTKVRNFIRTSFSGVGDALAPLQQMRAPITKVFQDIGATAKQYLDGYIKPVAKYILGDFIPSVTTGFLQSFVPVFADTGVWAVQEFSKTFANLTTTSIGLWNGTLLPAIENVKNAFLTAMPSIAASVQSLLDNTIKPFADYFANEFVIPIAADIQETFVPILSDVAVAAIEEFTDTFQWSVGIINDSYTNIIKPAMDLIKQVITDTLEILRDKWEKYGAGVIDKLHTAMDKTREIFQDLYDKIYKPIMVPFLEEMKKLWDEHLQGMVDKMMDFVMKLADAALEIYNGFIAPFIKWLIDTLGPTFVSTFNGVVKIISWAVGVIGDVIGDVFDILGGVIDFITGIFTGNWKKAWTGVKEIFKGIFETLYDIVKAPINLIIDGINEVIKGLNSLSIDIPDWVPKYGGKTFGIDIPKIPHLAKGGLAYGPTLAVVGDNIGAASDPEVVAPLSKLEGIMSGGNNMREVENLLRQLVKATQDGRSVQVVISESEVGQAATRWANDWQRRTGVSPINV